MTTCPLCTSPGGHEVFKNEQLRIVQATDTPNFPAFYRVIWNQHHTEFSQLTEQERSICMNAVVQVEKILIEHLNPTKINIASLGNVVPHLHWHVIARFDTDSHYPDPIWAPARKEPNKEHIATLKAQCESINQHIARSL